MRIQPVAPSPRPRFFGPTDAPFTPDSDLGGMILRMISTNALAAFTTQVAPTSPAQPVRNVAPGGAASASPAGDQPPTQRTLDAVPAAPIRPLPRGSLLDLRV